jgi:hypothetical protein
MFDTCKYDGLSNTWGRTHILRANQVQTGHDFAVMSLPNPGVGAVNDRDSYGAGNPVQKQASYATPTTINQIVACLQAAGLCM